MGKRSQFVRRPQDAYDTPYEAVLPLLPHLGSHHAPDLLYVELCAGSGLLVDHLKKHGHICTFAGDVEPRRQDVEKYDALELDWIGGAHCIITNPPWDRKSLHPMIEHFRTIAPYSWLLLDANWMFTKQAAPYLRYCSKIVTIGRVKWIPDSKMTGKDDSCWYRFEREKCETKFIGRT